MQELLAKCLSAYQDNQARIKTLEGHLQQYGYTTQQEFPAPSDPLAGFEASISRPAPPGLGPLNAPPPSSALQVRHAHQADITISLCCMTAQLSLEAQHTAKAYNRVYCSGRRQLQARCPFSS